MSDEYIKVNVPGDGSCLFWSTILAYLIPVKDNYDLFQERYRLLFGKSQTIEIVTLWKTLCVNNPSLSNCPLFTDQSIVKLIFIFRNKVADYITNHKEEFEQFIDENFDDYIEYMRQHTAWGGEVEINAISDMIGASINVSGASETNYGKYKIKIKLLHINGDGLTNNRNHYIFCLHRQIIDSYEVEKNAANQNTIDNYQKYVRKNDNSKDVVFFNIPKEGSDDKAQPRPTLLNRVVKWSDWYTEEQIKTNPNVIFLFGDNELAKYRTNKDNPGGSGQALATRPTGTNKLPYDRLPEQGGLNGNALGITTTFYSNYIPNRDEFQLLMNKEYKAIEAWVKAGGFVVIPCDFQGKHNLGTGIANLNKVVPNAIEYIEVKLNNLIALGQQRTENPECKNINTLKIELHETLYDERRHFESQKGLKGYLVNQSSGQLRPQQKRPILDDANNSKDSFSKKLRISFEELELESKPEKRLHNIEKDDDEETITKKLKIPEGYIASGVKNSLHGDVYQLKLLMLFLKRGIDEGYSFRLATEMDIAEKFDDVVFQYKEHGAIICRLLQAKHKQDDEKVISLRDLLTENDEEYSLQKYFISYGKILQNPEFKEQYIKDFIICTNIDFHEDLKKEFHLVTEEDPILGNTKSNDNISNRYKIELNKFSHKEKLLSTLQNTSNLRRLSKKMSLCLLNGEPLNLRDELFKCYHGILATVVVNVEKVVQREDPKESTKKYYAKFYDTFLDKNLKDKTIEKFRYTFMEFYYNIQKKPSNVDVFLQEMKTKEFQISKNFGKVFMPDINVKFTNCSEFVNKFIDLMSNANQDYIVKIKREGGKGKANIIKDNIDKLAGFVLVKKDENEKDIYYFSSSFLNDNSHLPNEIETFRRKLNVKFSIKNIDPTKNVYKFHIANFLSCEENQLLDLSSHVLPNDDISEAHIESFFEKLIFAVNQPNEIALGEIIKDELGKEFNNIDTKNVYARFLEEMLNWMKEKTGRFLTFKDGLDFFEKMKKEILGSVWFDVKPPIKSFTGRKKQLDKLHHIIQNSSDKVTIISQLTCISGLGGVGKTELARMYINEYSKYFYDNNVVWINAESEATLENSFYNLARDNKIGIPVKYKDGTDKPIKAIVKEIYRFFAKRQCLFIFDNAEIADYVIHFLPLRIFTPDDNKPVVIITSRVACDKWKDWGIEEEITLDVFTEEEAITFVRNALNADNGQNYQYQELKLLATDTLHNFPLALHQAVAYINMSNKRCRRQGRGDYTINNYIKDFERQTITLLNNEAFRNLDNDYAKTTLTTWKVTTDKIQDIEEFGVDAIDILMQMAYLAPKNIPVEIFVKFMLNAENVWGAVELLNEYSMINLYDGKVDIHELVQEVTRLGLEEGEKHTEAIGVAFDAIQESYPYDEIVKSEDCSIIKELLPHLEALLTHLENDKYKHKSEKDCIEFLLEFLINACSILGKPKRQKELLIRALSIAKERHGEEHSEVSRLIGNLGNTYGELGDYTKQMELQKQALALEEKKYGKDSIKIASTLVNLSEAYDHLGDDEKRKDLLERALFIQRKHYRKDNVKVALTLGNLGVVYGYLGDHSKKRKYLEEALAIEKKYYGNDHFEVARTMRNLGNAHGDLGNNKKQIELLKKSLLIQQHYYGEDHFEISSTLSDLSTAYGDLGNHQKQKKILEKVLTIQQQHYGNEHIEIVGTLIDLSTTCAHLGNHDQSRKLREQALLMVQTHYGDKNYEVADTLKCLGNVFGNAGDHQQQKELLERALLVQTRYSGDDNIEVVNLLKELSIVYECLNDYQRQREYLSKALSIQRKNFKPEHNINIADTLIKLSSVSGHLKDCDQERKFLNEAFIIIEEHNDDDFEDIDIVITTGKAFGNLGEHQRKLDLLKRALRIQKENLQSVEIEICETLTELNKTYGDLGNYKQQKESEKE